MAHRRRGVGVGRTSAAASAAAASRRGSRSPTRTTNTGASSGSGGTGTSSHDRYSSSHQSRVQRKADEIRAQSFQNAVETIEQIQAQLTEYARKNQNVIQNDPAFRQQFLQMCAPLGVDPLVSPKGFWAKTLGVGTLCGGFLCRFLFFLELDNINRYFADGSDSVYLVGQWLIN